MTLPLTGYRVVELGSLEGASYAGKLFSDFGAEVIKLEPPGGDPSRRQAPLVDVGDERTESAFAAWLNTAKHSVVIHDEDDPAIDGLVAAADLVIDALAPLAAARRRARWRACNPGVSVLSVSWFGETGPYAGFVGSDMVVRALAGLVKLTGPVEGPPIALNDHQASIFCGLTAYTAGLSALYSDRPRAFEVSVLEACVTLAEFQFELRLAPAELGGRQGVNKFFPTYPLGIFRCREGWLGVTVATVPQWQAFCALLEMPNVETDPRFQTRFGRSGRMAEIDHIIEERLRVRTADEWFELGMQHRIPLVPVPDMAELLGQEWQRRRQAFSRITIGAACFEAPRVPLHLNATPARLDAVAPMLGQGQAAFTGARVRSGDSPTSPPDARPLAGMRILDLSMGWAGPLVTRQLGDLGAEIVKIEAVGYPDWWRHWDGDALPKSEYSPWFIALNRNKLDVGIDIYKAGGVDLVRRLVPHVDAIVENFAPNVIPRLGLAYSDVRVLNPSIVMLSMPAYTDRWSRLRAYGSTLEQGSGLPSVTGPADGPPMLNHLAYGDPMGGLSGAAALLTALLHRQRTGEGQEIQLSQIQAMLPLTARWMIEQSLTGKVVRMGNRHPTSVPHGIFPTADPDGWIAISVSSDACWQALARTIGRPDLLRLADAARRRAGEGEIEAAIAGWTAGRPGDAVMAMLQAAGVSAGVVRAPSRLDQDPHLIARGNWVHVDRRYSGAQPVIASPFRENAAPYPIVSAAPTLGQHNEQVLRTLLGLTTAEIAGHVASGAIGSTEAMATQTAGKAA